MIKNKTTALREDVPPDRKEHDGCEKTKLLRTEALLSEYA